MNRKINSKILNMLSWPVFAVGQSPYRIDPEQPENTDDSQHSERHCP